jgi:hypothetical protein
MLGRWREEFNAGRAAVRAGVRVREPVDPSPAPAGTPDVAEVGSLRALLGELREIAELSQARIAELETALTAMHWRAERLADALQVPGVKKVLVRLVHPDAHPDADEDQRRALTEASSKINAAYDLIDRAKDTTP